MKKRYLLLLLLLALFCSGCGSAADRAQTAETEGPRVIASIYPLYDWTRELLGENPGDIGLSALLSDGVDMHSYQPSVTDIVRLSECDLFVYVGGESDAWVDDALKNAVNPNLIALNLMEILEDSLYREETVEGMQTGGEEAEDAYDEHIWLSLRNAGRCCEAIEDALSGLDPEHAEIYAENSERYRAALAALDAAYSEAAENGSASGSAHGVLVVADRFPFRYLAGDYGLNYYAAFSGCEAETEASFETVAFLAGKVDALGLNYVLTTESPIPRLAETVIENTRQKTAGILTLNSMQGAAPKDGNYLTVMEENLEVLKEAMG